MHTQEEKKKRKNAISMLWRKSKIVKFIYEYKTLMQEHTIVTATNNNYISNYKRKTWKGDRN